MLSTILKIVSELIDFESLVDQRSAHSNVRPCSATLPVVSRVRADPAGLACKAEEAGEGQGYSLTNILPGSCLMAPFSSRFRSVLRMVDDGKEEVVASRSMC